MGGGGLEGTEVLSTVCGLKTLPSRVKIHRGKRRRAKKRWLRIASIDTRRAVRRQAARDWANVCDRFWQCDMALSKCFTGPTAPLLAPRSAVCESSCVRVCVCACSAFRVHRGESHSSVLGLTSFQTETFIPVRKDRVREMDAAATPWMLHAGRSEVCVCVRVCLRAEETMLAVVTLPRQVARSLCPE